MNYLNPELNVDKLDLSDNYLAKGNPGQVNPNEAFVGNPRNEKFSFGANAPVLVNAAEKYYKKHLPEENITVENLTGSNFSDLLNYVIGGYPVMIWGTINLLEPYVSVTWEINDEEIQWLAQFHCMVLVGFDINKNIYYIADPLREGITEYDMPLLEKRYEQLGKQAVVIY